MPGTLWGGILALTGFTLAAATGLVCMWRLSPRFVEWSHTQYGDEDHN